MTFWLVDFGQCRGEHPALEPYIIMPEYNERDWSKIRNKKQIKHHLLIEDELMPPEEQELIAQTIIKFVFNIKKDDFVCAVHQEEGKLQAVYFAKVIDDVFYDAEAKEHHLPLEWYKEKGTKARLWRYRLELIRADSWPRTIGDKKLVGALSSFLPLPGNRFIKWIWIILLILVIAKLGRMSHRWLAG